jgi:hypothetical protein
MRLRLLPLAASFAVLLAPAAAQAVTITPGANTVTTSRFNLDFGNSLSERIDTLSWKQSNGAFTPNLTANGGDFCGDTDSPSREWWGESYSTTDGGFSLVAATSRGSWAKLGTTQVRNKDSMDPACAGYSPTVPITTTYAFTDGEPYASTIKVQRKYGFTKTTPTLNGPFRPYVPRLPIGTYDQVVWPNAADTALNTSFTCGTACGSSDWDGTWMALDSSSTGSGMIILRDTTDTIPGVVVTDNDALSASNLSSVALLEPTAGWHKTFTETEYLCFYDSKSWPAAKRSALKLPKGCGPTPLLTLNPTTGAAGSNVKLTGVGFAPGENVDVAFKEGTTSTPLATVVADKFGAISTTQAVPGTATSGATDKFSATGETSHLKEQSTFHVS